MSDPRAINPSRCWVRHVRRTVAGETGTTIARGAFIADTVEDLGGRQGWQSGSVIFALSDDGEGTIRFPNAAGADGRLHRRRFALLTDPAYRIGEEWLEVYRDADELVAVITPQSYSLGRSELVIKGPDLAAVLRRFRSTDLEPWVGAAPRDVFEHYTRAPVLIYGTELRGLTGIPASGGAGGVTGTTTDPQAMTYQLGIGATATTGPDGEIIIASPSNLSSLAKDFGAGASADCWTIEARWRILDDPEPNGSLYINVNADGNNSGLYLQTLIDLANGGANLTGFAAPGPHIGGGEVETGRRQGLAAIGPHSARIAAFYDRVFMFVDGELVNEVRRPTPFRAPTRVEVFVGAATGVIDAINVRSLAPFALRGADKGDLHLPGVLPPVGVRGRYYNAAPVYARFPTVGGRVARLPERVGDEPYAERLHPTLNLPLGALPPSAAQIGALWTGAIYLDLAASDRRIRITFAGSSIAFYIGKTRGGLDALIDHNAPTPTATIPLRSHLGSKAGWYPFRLELRGGGGAGSGSAAVSVTLEDGAADAGGVVASYAALPQSRLSPIGTYDELVRLESHREVIRQITEAFGYQWRVEPRQLESGEFPGQIIPRVRVGKDYDLRITIDRAVDVAVEGDAGDAVDVLVADAAGIADPKGSGQLSAEVIDLANARAHAFLHGDYESLSEISEAPMLETRLGSLLALRSSVNENVGARPDGQRDLLDTFPLTGASSRMDWRPGDGGLLDLDDVDVRDTGPRQLTRVEWPFVPDGFGRPVVGFRQRPRSAAAVLRRALRVALSGQRNYQGTLATLVGPHGGSTGVAAAYDGSVDAYSRLAVPGNLDDIVAAYVSVELLTGAWTLYVNGISTGVTIIAPGLYDVTRWVARESLAAARVYAHLANPNPATAGSSYALKLHLIVRI